MKVSLKALLNYIQPPGNVLDQWDETHQLLEDIGLEVKRVEPQDTGDLHITLELLANRGDHHCYFGLAREIHGRTAWPLVKPETKTLPNDLPSLPVEVVNRSELCLAYTLTEYKLPETARSLSDDFLAMIELSGSQIVSPAVDVTNLCNLELGQPMHVFDADTIDGAIDIRTSTAGEQARFLGAEKMVDLPEGTLVIADASKILAVAGVIGCDESKPTETTRRVYLESATFDPVSVRQSARALGLQTLSCTRFERGADPSMAEGVLIRAHYLLESTGWQIGSRTAVAAQYDQENPVIKLDLKALNCFFDTDFSQEDITHRLQRYGFEKAFDDQDCFAFKVPGHRIWDIKTAEDLYEEIAKSIGYNELPSCLPASASGVLPSQMFLRKVELEQRLLSRGFFEVFTDGFYSDQDAAVLGLESDHPLMQHVRINNSETKAYSLLKNNNLIQALQMVSLNLNVKNTQISAFEWNRRFIPNHLADNGLCMEEKVVWGLSAAAYIPASWQEKAKPFDFYHLKMLISEIDHCLKLGLTFKRPSTLAPALISNSPQAFYADVLHPHRSLAVMLDEKVVGIFGEVHPRLLAQCAIKNVRPVFFELQQSLLDAPVQAHHYKAPSNILAVKRDICLQLDGQVAAGDIAQFLEQQSQLLEAVEISDSFEISSSPQLQRALTFALIYHPQRVGKDVFESEALNTETERLAQCAIDHFGKSVVSRR